MGQHYALALDLTLSSEKLERMYAGSAKTVFARCLDGRSIRFPVGILRPFITHDGVCGRFEIIFDEKHKFQSIHRIGAP